MLFRSDQFLDKFLKLTRSIRLGNPLDPATEMGPLTSTMHRDRVMSYIEVAKQQGSQILTGGKAPDGAEFAQGCYIEPTVVTANPNDRVCQEEVFGPFVSVTRFKDEAEVLEIANNTEYGLGGGLWTTNLQRAHRAAAAIRAGMVWVNTYKRASPNSPFGGVGKSGYGRDLGLESIQDYTTPKSIWINYDGTVPPFYKR